MHDGESTTPPPPPPPISPPQEDSDTSNHHHNHDQPQQPQQQQQPDSMSLGRERFYSNRWRGDEDEYQLRWESHSSQLAATVARLEHDETSSDMTVATKGASIPSHRLVLAAASPFFCHVLQGLPIDHHPVVVVKTAHPRHLRYLISFCYSGAVTLPSQDVNEVLQLAEDLEISGLRNTPPPSLSTLYHHHYNLHHKSLHPVSPPTKFPFTPPLYTRPSSSSSSPDIFPGRKEERGMKKRSSSTLELKEIHNKKLKIEPLTLDEDLPPYPSSSPYHTPPGSAPPSLAPFPSPSIFRSPPISPPSSAPPRPASVSLSLGRFEDEKEQDAAGLRVVAPSRLLQPPSRSSSRHSTPTPQTDNTSPPGPSPPTSVPQTPTALTRALLEPATPSTPSTPTTPREGGGGGSGSRVLLWRFLLDLLHDSRYTPMYIRWLDRPNGIFRIMESDMVAQLWGRARNNSNMNYEKMSRGMRTYYKRGILVHIDGTKLIYRFNTNDAEIQQRMRYYDLTNVEGDEAREQNNTSPSFAASSSLANSSTLSLAPPVSTASLESIYSQYLPHRLLYDQLLHHSPLPLRAILTGENFTP